MNVLRRLETKLFILDEQQWFTDLLNDDGNYANGNKLRTYRLFKKDLCPEPNVIRILPTMTPP